MLCYATVLVLSSINVLAAQIHPSTGPAFKDEYIMYAGPSYPMRYPLNVHSVLKAGANVSAHIEDISNAALASDGNNTINVKYTYKTSESAAHRSRALTDGCNNSPQWI
jgi:hypothetical protein